MPRKKNKSNDSDEKKNDTPGDDDEGLIAYCTCKGQMVPVRTDSIYEKYMPVFCNNCWAHVPHDGTVYNCPRGRCWDHLVGYDICVKCAKAQSKENKLNAKKDNKNDKNSKNNNKKLSNLFNKKNDQNNNDKNNQRSKHSNLNISPTLQAILTQQFYSGKLDNINGNNDKDSDEYDEQSFNSLKQMSVIDEITRLSALCNSTLSLLSYSNQHNDGNSMHNILDLQQMLIKYSALTQLQTKMQNTISDLQNETSEMISTKVGNWKQWNSAQLSEWVMSLDAGRFYKKYCAQIDKDDDKVNIVKESIIQQNICGKHLALDDKKKDLMIQSLGINDFDDRLALLDHIQNLTNGVFRYGNQKQDLLQNNIRNKKLNNANIINKKEEAMVPAAPGEMPEVEGVNLNNNM